MGLVVSARIPGERSLQLLMEMKQQRIQPNALGYSIGIEACEADGSTTWTAHICDKNRI